jgi:hypothetical protein
VGLTSQGQVDGLHGAPEALRLVLQLGQQRLGMSTLLSQPVLHHRLCAPDIGKNK